MFKSPGKTLLILITVLYLLFLLGLPLAVVFQTAFRHGMTSYIEAITQPDTVAAMKLTFWVVLCAVPLNILFGISLAWAVTRFSFPGKLLLISCIDIPFAVSPVISGLMFLLLFGSNTPLGAWFINHDQKIMFAVPGILLATTFVTLPFVARELIPVMNARGVDQELAALTLGASPLQMFWTVTLPNVKWALFYGTMLCTARAIGEFGAVAVVSGHIRGLTNTLPLHIEILYNEYHFTAAFSVATLLVFMAVFSLVGKFFCEKRGSGRSPRNMLRHKGSV